MTYEGLGEMFEGDSAETCAGKNRGPPALSHIWGVKGGIFKSCPKVLNSDMTSEGLGGM